MAKQLRFLPAGIDALLVELDDLDTALALLDGLHDARLDGVSEVIPAAKTVMVRFDPFITGPARVADALCAIDLSARTKRQGEVFEIPVIYDGEDIQDVAHILGWSAEEVVRRHSSALFTVAFTGFAPGFAYMTCDDPGFDVPRRREPRLRVPAGSVSIAGRFGSIYPSDSPGGWQLLGTTPLKMWDTTRERASLLAPGDRVRFRNAASDARAPVIAPPPKGPVQAGHRAGLLVTQADRPALYQDMGRRGQAHQGVSESGAADRASLRAANRCVGNPPDDVAIEITFGGFAFRTDRTATVAVAGARCPLTIRTAAGQEVVAFPGQPLALDAGDAPLATPSGRIEIFSEAISKLGYPGQTGHPVWLDPEEWVGAEKAKRYPLHLLTPQPARRLHGQLESSSVSMSAKGAHDLEVVSIHPSDAHHRGIEDGDVVRLSNERGACFAVAGLCADIVQGVLFLPTGASYDPDGMSDRNSNPNVLTRDIGTSELGQGCAAQSCLVEIERVRGKPPTVRVYSPPRITTGST